MAHSLDVLPNRQCSNTSIELTLYSGHRAAGEAREQLAAQDGLVPHSCRNELLLLVTELVTNAVRHGGGCNGMPVQVTLARRPRVVRVAVTDPGAGFEWRGRSPGRAPEASGYGLLLVERTAARWGIERGEESTTVWFELRPD